MRHLIAFIAVSTIFGCASRPNIDTSGKDSVCAQACSSEYDSCMSGITMVPIQRTYDCAKLLTYCAKACPEKK